MSARLVTVKTLRPLNDRELEIVETALQRLAESKDPKAKFAKIMLDESMPANFLWADGGESRR